MKPNREWILKHDREMSRRRTRARAEVPEEIVPENVVEEEEGEVHSDAETIPIPGRGQRRRRTEAEDEEISRDLWRMAAERRGGVTRESILRDLESDDPVIQGIALANGTIIVEEQRQLRVAAQRRAQQGQGPASAPTPGPSSAGASDPTPGPSWAAASAPRPGPSSAGAAPPRPLPSSSRAGPPTLGLSPAAAASAPTPGPSWTGPTVHSLPCPMDLLYHGPGTPMAAGQPFQFQGQGTPMAAGQQFQFQGPGVPMTSGQPFQFQSPGTPITAGPPFPFQFSGVPTTAAGQPFQFQGSGTPMMMTPTACSTGGQRFPLQPPMTPRTGPPTALAPEERIKCYDQAFGAIRRLNLAFSDRPELRTLNITLKRVFRDLDDHRRDWLFGKP